MPFQNLKFLLILNKALGLFSCKLVNGRLKLSSVWSFCYCKMWLLCQCLYTAISCYMIFVYLYTAVFTMKEFSFTIMRAIMFFIGILPYNLVPIFWSEKFIRFSDKLLTYDEHAITLGHPRKDKHTFIYLLFVFMCIAISWALYYDIRDLMLEGIETLFVTQSIIPVIRGSYCVLITCIFLDLIRQRFRHLNETIIPHVSQLPVTGSQGEITVYNVRYLHGVLLDSAELINILYGIGTLLMLMSVLIEAVWSLYKVIVGINENVEIHDDFRQFMHTWIQIIYLLAMYHFTTYEANRVEERVIQYGIPFSNMKCRMDKIEMMLYFYHRRYSFTAAEFFPLNITIILPITTAITTYLILLVV